MTVTTEIQNPHLMMLRQAAEGFQRFTAGPAETNFSQIGERTYLWQWFHYSSLVIRGQTGLLVVDPANRHAAGLLREQLEKRFPRQPVHSLIYSHEHLDHASGGGVFAPRTVVGHHRMPDYLEDHPHHDVVPPTLLLQDGDRTLELDGVGIELVHVPGAHTESLFAIRIPDESILYVADLAAVRCIPFVLQNLYIPGAIRALDRLLSLDFEQFVPAHFQVGTKQDLAASAGFLKDLRHATGTALRETGLSMEADTLYRLFEQIYETLAARYRDWRGFNEQIPTFVMRGLFGEVIGY